LTKTASQPTYSALNEMVTYQFEVVNTGNVTLNNVVVEDPLFGINFGPVDLAPDSSETYTYVYTVTQAEIETGSIFNIAFAEGLDPMGDPVNDMDTVAITAIQNPSLHLSKSANPQVYDEVGDLIQYTFIATNTGNVTLNSVEV